MATQENILEAVTSASVSHRKFYGWNNAALIFFIQFAASGFVFFAYSVIFPEMVSTMNWNRGDASIAHSLGFVMLGLSYPVTAWLIGKKGVRFTFTLGLSVMLVGLLMVTLLVSEVWHWTMVWGLVMGVSFGLTGPICGHTLIINWFNIRRATVLGIIVTGSAVGGFVAQPLIARIMAYFGSWQSGWVTSMIAIVGALVITQFLVNKPEDVAQHPDGIDPASDEGMDSKNTRPRTYRSAQDWTLRQVFKTPSIFLMMLIAVTYLAVGTFLLTHGALHLSDIGISTLDTATLVGIFIFGSGAGRIPAGMLGDRIELRWLIAAIMGMMLIGFVIFGSSTSFPMLAISGFITGCCYGGKFALAPAMISNYFGEKSFPMINSVYAPLLLPFVAMAPAGAGYIYEAYGNYDLAFLIGSGLIGLSTLAAAALKPPVFKPASAG